MNKKSQADTELKLLQDKILQLQKENEILSNHLFEVNEKLRDSEKLKSHFISNITNEIVNPFTGIMALAGNMKKLKEGELRKIHHMADLIFEEASHLDFQLRNIFAVAMIESGNERLNYSKVNILSVIDQVQSYFNHLAEKKGISLLLHFNPEVKSREGVEITADQEKLLMILKNLVNNSIKYSPDDSEIDLTVDLDGEKLKFIISDRGKGIDPSARKIIFDRFKQLDEKINSINTGHGLGLSVVLAYTEMMDGTIEISDNYPGGACVTVNIPGHQDDMCNEINDFLFDSEIIF